MNNEIVSKNLFIVWVFFLALIPFAVVVFGSFRLYQEQYKQTVASTPQASIVTNGITETIEIATVELRPTSTLVPITVPTLPNISNTGELVAYYPLDGTANDESGNGYQAIVHGATWIEARGGQALNFDGNDHVVTSLDMTKVWDVGDPIHLSIWIKATQANGIALAGDPGGGPDFAAVVRDNRVKVRLYGGTVADSDILVNDGKWYNVSWGTDGINSYFYVNGAPQSQAPSVGNYNRETALMLGARGNPASYFFVGVIDEVAIYDGPLSADKIMHLYKLGVSAEIP